MSAALDDPRLPAHFWAKVEFGDSPAHQPGLGRCWIWTAAKNSRGYGAWSVAGAAKSTHRVTYETLVGPIGVGLTLDHLCRVKRCCNPAHLEPVTRRVNTQRHYDAQTHCINGHELAGANLARHGTRGTRSCVTCRREANRRYRLRIAS